MSQNTRRELVVGKKHELNNCVFTLNILVSELVSAGKMEYYLQQANLAFEDWGQGSGIVESRK